MQSIRLRAAVGLGTALALICDGPPARGQEPLEPALVARVQDAAFDHWWPKYRRLMDTLIENQDVDSGRLKVPPPAPEDLRREIHIGPGFNNPYLPGYTFLGVHTQGAVFEGLFLMEPSGQVSVLVNHDDPEDRKPLLEDAYVDHMNRILNQAEVTVEDARQAASLARFFLSLFFNFPVHSEDALIEPSIQDELQRVRVISSYREIPQGRRALKFGTDRAFLVFEPVPSKVREAIAPAAVGEPAPGKFEVELFTWHPVHGEVKEWQILIENDRFAFFRDETVGRWKPYRFAGMK